MRATSAPRHAGGLTSAPPACQLPRLLPAFAGLPGQPG